jgi:hypothetical protein
VLLWRCPIQAQVVPLPPQAAVALTVAGFEGVRIIAAALHHCPGPFSCVYGGNRDDVTHFGVPVEELYIYIYYLPCAVTVVVTSARYATLGRIHFELSVTGAHVPQTAIQPTGYDLPGLVRLPLDCFTLGRHPDCV